eukprot:snap_masked-scaffold_25-processed-gene-0.14-mRNA-1 protein AED:1.00 eAED:1.00 QI:0/0/0/0/1/1/2/0/62
MEGLSIQDLVIELSIPLHFIILMYYTLLAAPYGDEPSLPLLQMHGQRCTTFFEKPKTVAVSH